MNNSIKDVYVDFDDESARAKCTELIPVHVFICFMMLCGLIGNTLTCVFYLKKQKTTPTSRLIVCLAVIDTGMCIFMPVNIIIMCRAYLGYPSIICRINVFCGSCGALTSIIILISIATFRARLVAKPTSWQFTVKHANIAIALSLIGAVSLSLPRLFMHETMDVTITIAPSNALVTGRICSITQEPEARTFNIILFVSLGAATTSLGVLYCYIGMKIYKYYQKKKLLKQKPKYSATPDLTFATDDLSDNIPGTATQSGLAMARPDRVVVPDQFSARTDLTCVSDDMRGKKPGTVTLSARVVVPNNDIEELQQTSIDINQSTSVHETNAEPATPEDESNVIDVPKTHTIKERTHLNAIKMADAMFSAIFVRQAAMMFVVTLVFLVSFLPYLIAGRIMSRDKFNDAFVNRYQFAVRSFVINSAANPFIYGIFNSEFRNFVKSLFIGAFSRCFIVLSGTTDNN